MVNKPGSETGSSREDFEQKRLDLERATRSVVALRAVAPDDAFTAQALGTERAGSGIVIRESGLVLTIGYLITEAQSVWLTGSDGKVVPAHPLAYDQETGFGLVQALGALDLPSAELGSASDADLGDPVLIAAGRGQTTKSRIVAKQEFAGFWEYLLDEAIFAAPAHPFWGGAGMFGPGGKLLGVGSLHVQQVGENGDRRDSNMIVPIDLLPPILDDLLAYGRVNRPARPWLGVFSGEIGGRIVVASLADHGPGAAAGLREGDIISAVGDSNVESLADFYRKVWSRGPAGVEIPVEVVRDGRSRWLRIKSADRGDFLKKPRLH